MYVTFFHLLFTKLSYLFNNLQNLFNLTSYYGQNKTDGERSADPDVSDQFFFVPKDAQFSETY